MSAKKPTGRALTEHASEAARAEAEPGVLLSALDGAGVPFEAHGLAAKLLLAVAAHAAEIERACAKGTIELHWGPNGISGRLTHQWDERLSADLLAEFTPTPSASPSASPSAPRSATKRHLPAVRRRGLGELVIIGTEDLGTT